VKQTLGVVVPVYNEAESVPYFYSRAKPVLDSLGLDWRILFVNDGSTDGSLDEILALRKADPRVGVLTHSRNFGYHAALSSGLKQLGCDLYAIVDVDCEDPPETLAAFHAEIEKGAYTVYGIRSKRDEPAYMIFLRKLFYLVNESIADGPARPWMGEFVMIRRAVRDAILDNRTTFPFLRAEMGYVGLRLSGVPYRREKRRFGESHYNLWRMTRFAVAGFLASSTFPLRAVSYGAAWLGALYLGFIAWARPGLAVAAQAAEIGGFLFLLGSVPMIALYLARDYKNGAARPTAYVDPEATFLP
jgi:polyisoprenyl-phosphate glycosyltransferase